MFTKNYSVSISSPAAGSLAVPVRAHSAKEAVCIALRSYGFSTAARILDRFDNDGADNLLFSGPGGIAADARRI